MQLALYNSVQFAKRNSTQLNVELYAAGYVQLQNSTQMALELATKFYKVCLSSYSDFFHTVGCETLCSWLWNLSSCMDKLDRQLFIYCWLVVGYEALCN